MGFDFHRYELFTGGITVVVFHALTQSKRVIVLSQAHN